MQYDILSYQLKNRVMTLFLNGNGNCYGAPVQVANELIELANIISLTKEIQVVIVHLEQTIHPENIQLNQIEPNTDPGRAHPFSWAAPISRIEVPVIMSINGYALGQALELALACDIRMASSGSVFGLPHINNGVIPWDGGTQRLSRLIGKSNAMEMILTGQSVNGEQAFRMGLVNRLSGPDDLLPTVLETAGKMAGKGPLALRYTKEVVLMGSDLKLDQALALEADLYFLLHTSIDRTEGIKAFQEKRNPEFRGE
jgi:enoyl-CoA hydratase/carnithine racemase